VTDTDDTVQLEENTTNRPHEIDLRAGIFDIEDLVVPLRSTTCWDLSVSLARLGFYRGPVSNVCYQELVDAFETYLRRFDTLEDAVESLGLVMAESADEDGED
jgi:hypothetical protein